MPQKPKKESEHVTTQG